jgi:hypothetical protein
MRIDALRHWATLYLKVLDDRQPSSQPFSHSLEAVYMLKSVRILSAIGALVTVTVRPSIFKRQ